MSANIPVPCERCGVPIITARGVGGGVRIMLDAIPVVGGDYASWTVGYDPDNLLRLYARRPKQVSPPHDMPAMERERWDGYAAANERAWYVEHRHGLQGAEVVAQRASD